MRRCAHGLSTSESRSLNENALLLKNLLENHFDDLDEWQQSAYRNMLDQLERDQDLTPKQRENVDRCAEKLGVAIRYENLVSSGKVKGGMRPLFPPEMLPKRPPLKRDES